MNISNWMAQHLVLSLTSTFIFNVKLCEFYFFCEYLVFGEREQTILLLSDRMPCICIEWCHCEFCTSWPWPKFSSSQKLWKYIIYNIWKTVKASDKCSSMTFIEVDIRHQTVSLRMWYIVNFTFIFKVNFGHEFWNVNNLKRVKARDKCSSMTFIEMSNLPSNGTIASVVLCDLVLNFKDQTFQVAILTSKCWKFASITIVIR